MSAAAAAAAKTASKLLVLVLAATAIAACDGGADRRARKGAGKGADDAPAAVAEDGPHEINVARPAFQAKSSTQLARSLEACVGPDAIWVTPSMIASATSTSGFLTSDFNDGDNIIEVQTGLFDGTVEAMRTGVRVDQLSLEYITALKNVANVAGTRCSTDLVSAPEMCVCETDDAAKAMLTRCLAAVADPTTPEFADLAKAFGTACKANRGSAIASMIASLAFAKVP